MPLTVSVIPRRQITITHFESVHKKRKRTRTYLMHRSQSLEDYDHKTR